MHSLWWTLSVILLFVGLAGTILPFLPGTTIILAGAVLHFLTVKTGWVIGWWTLAALTALTLLSVGLDFLSGTLGARWAGATAWGVIGGIVGLFIGMGFGLLGLFAGPLLGVLVGELIAGKKLHAAGKATLGTFIGTTAGMIAQFVIGIVMIVWFFLAAAW